MNMSKQQETFTSVKPLFGSDTPVLTPAGSFADQLTSHTDSSSAQTFQRGADTTDVGGASEPLTLSNQCTRLLADNQKLREDLENARNLISSSKLANQQLHEVNEKEHSDNARLSKLNSQLERHKTTLESAIAQLEAKHARCPALISQSQLARSNAEQESCILRGKVFRLEEDAGRAAEAN